MDDPAINRQGRLTNDVKLDKCGSLAELTQVSWLPGHGTEFGFSVTCVLAQVAGCPSGLTLGLVIPALTQPEGLAVAQGETKLGGGPLARPTPFCNDGETNSHFARHVWVDVPARRTFLSPQTPSS